MKSSHCYCSSFNSNSNSSFSNPLLHSSPASTSYDKNSSINTNLQQFPFQKVQGHYLVSVRLWNGTSYARCIGPDTLVSGVIREVLEKTRVSHPQLEQQSGGLQWQLVLMHKRWSHSAKCCKPVGTWTETVLDPDVLLLTTLKELCNNTDAVADSSPDYNSSNSSSLFQLFLHHPALTLSVMIHPSLQIPDIVRGRNAAPQGFHIVRRGFMPDMKASQLFSMLNSDFLWNGENLKGYLLIDDQVKGTVPITMILKVNFIPLLLRTAAKLYIAVLPDEPDRGHCGTHEKLSEKSFQNVSAVSQCQGCHLKHCR